MIELKFTGMCEGCKHASLKLGYEEYQANSVFSDTVLEQKDPQVYNKTLST